MAPLSIFSSTSQNINACQYIPDNLSSKFLPQFYFSWQPVDRYLLEITNAKTHLLFITLFSMDLFLHRIVFFMKDLNAIYLKKEKTIAFKILSILGSAKGGSKTRVQGRDRARGLFFYIFFMAFFLSSILNSDFLQFADVKKILKNMLELIFSHHPKQLRHKRKLNLS